jgi:hypothetical protein
VAIVGMVSRSARRRERAQVMPRVRRLGDRLREAVLAVDGVELTGIASACCHLGHRRRKTAGRRA